MFRVQKITSFEQPELEPYRTMRRSAEHVTQGIFVAEGDKVVQRLLESRFPIVSVVLPENRLEEFRPLLEARTEDFEVYLAERRFLVTLTGIELFQGFLAVGKIPHTFSLDDLLAQSASPKLFATVDGLTNAENIGLLVRNCAAFGAHGLIVSPTCCSPFLRRSVRNSMGTIFELPIVELGSTGVAVLPGASSADAVRNGSVILAEALKKLRARGVRCIAAHPHTDKRTLAQADFTRDCCIIFGSEGTGISPEVLAVCDEAVAIPMAGKVDSLNVGACAAVFLYEAQRQRQKTF
ncbi:MAG TPA: RNA methyltransferase [Verrucomicrobiae bacterium]|jgi:tRNA G18 (ribose-2'-O)-methylase SpoU